MNESIEDSEFKIQDLRHSTHLDSHAFGIFNLSSGIVSSRKPKPGASARESQVDRRRGGPRWGAGPTPCEFQGTALSSRLGDGGRSEIGGQLGSGHGGRLGSRCEGRDGGVRNDYRLAASFRSIRVTLPSRTPGSSFSANVRAACHDARASLLRCNAASESPIASSASMQLGSVATADVASASA